MAKTREIAEVKASPAGRLRKEATMTMKWIGKKLKAERVGMLADTLHQQQK